MSNEISKDRGSIIHHIEWLALMVTLLGGMYLIDGKIERQGARTDKLYEMFIDLVKEVRK
jgi:hypothetical protein